MTSHSRVCLQGSPGKKCPAEWLLDQASNSLDRASRHSIGMLVILPTGQYTTSGGTFRPTYYGEVGGGRWFKQSAACPTMSGSRHGWVGWSLSGLSNYCATTEVLCMDARTKTDPYRGA